MDIKVKHRILGIVVIIGLLVILLPFFQRGKEMSPDIAAIKTPPFPDQPVQVTAPATPTSMAPATPAANPTPTTPTTSTEPATPTATTMLQFNEDVKNLPDDTIKADHINAINTQAAVAPPIPNPIVADPIVPKKKAVPALAQKKQQLLKHIAVKTEKRTPIRIHTPIDNNGLFKLHTASWVLQVGTYKNKAHALRIVNNLRANGYPAFIQQLSDNTRVYVGPENSPTSARELAQSIENDLHLQSIVISYKPLSL